MEAHIVRPGEARIETMSVGSQKPEVLEMWAERAHATPKSG